MFGWLGKKKPRMSAQDAWKKFVRNEGSKGATFGRFRFFYDLIAQQADVLSMELEDWAVCALASSVADALFFRDTPLGVPVPPPGHRATIHDGETSILLAPVYGRSTPVQINGTTYPANAPCLLPANNIAVGILASSGWTTIGPVGRSSQRLTKAKSGQPFIDTDLGGVVFAQAPRGDEVVQWVGSDGQPK